MGDTADWQLDQMLTPGDGCDGIDEYYEEDGMGAPWDAVADYGLKEAGVIGFVKTPCRTCRTFHAEGECPGPEPEPEWVEPESIPDRAKRLVSRHTRYDGSPR